MPPPPSTARVRTAIVVALLLLAPRVGRADRVDSLAQLLATAPSYKVRLQIAITLGRLGDRRAVPALIAALRDADQNVQGAAAAALGQIGDRRADAQLRLLLERTRSVFVQKQVGQALALLQEGPPLPADARFFVAVGTVANRATTGGTQLSQRLAESLLRRFAQTPGVAAGQRDRLPSARRLRQHGAVSYLIDGSIEALSHQASGSEILLSCTIRVSLATYPENSMKAFYSGGATMAVPARDFDRAHADELYAELLDGAAEGARDHLVQSYLRVTH
ncbi:MAG: HEAT repeat domain-containing protein [Proteobacteria bacterium]|nr:HEAT repeat domain-containing protein [Pseudomonadota bacterium]